jgi:enoyl-CoA hydratase/carnithine racemase
VTDPVTVERDGHVLLIGVNRPAQRNAFDLAVIEALGAAYETLGTDQELRAGVLFGHGDHFSAGLDLAQVGPAVAQDGPGALGSSHRFDPFGVWRDPVPKPVVLAVNGIAYTLSIELALAADIVVAADDVRFRQLEIGRGILPFGGATFRAPAQLGWGNAMRFLLTAEEFGAAEALRIGLVQEVVPAGSHLQRARELAQLIARQAPLGVQGTLASARAGRSHGPDAAREHLLSLLPGILHSQDAAEGLRSFTERREGRFTGPGQPQLARTSRLHRGNRPGGRGLIRPDRGRAHGPGGRIGGGAEDRQWADRGWCGAGYLVRCRNPRLNRARWMWCRTTRLRSSLATRTG